MRGRAGVVEAVVAVPVRNEEERIGACLQALAVQAGLNADALGLVLLVNNTTDGTLRVIAGARSDLPYEQRVVVRDSPDANAGWARRGAMEIAAEWLEATGRDGAILTTDGDSEVDAHWVTRNLAALAGGADAVAGTISLHPADAARLSPALQARGRLEAEYHALLDELAAVIDSDPNDPWPNHAVESGASLAVKLSAYRRVGGMPPIALGDDRAFVARLREQGCPIRHDPSVQVSTSGRLVGRAAGGVADTMRIRQDDPDCPCDARLVPFPEALLRERWHRRSRRLRERGCLPEPLPAAEGRSEKVKVAALRPSEIANNIAAAKVFLQQHRPHSGKPEG